MTKYKWLILFAGLTLVGTVRGFAPAQTPEKATVKKRASAQSPKAAWVVPKLPDGKTSLTDTSPDFLKPIGPLKAGVTIAKTPPTVDVLVYPGQDYEGRPWSNWGDGCFANGKFYSAIGDHLSPAGTGRVFEYDPQAKTLRQIVDLKTFYHRPDGHYSPAKIHSRLDMGSDGWIYFSTHRGSPGTSNDENHFQGDDILRVDPQTAKVEVVARSPVEKHCIPTSILDPKRMIFYGGTAPGKDSTSQSVQFLAYDVQNHKVLYRGDDGPARSMLWSSSTGKVYYVPGSTGAGKLLKFDPAAPSAPTPIDVEMGIRAATFETPQGVIYTASNGQGDNESELFAFDVKTEKVEKLGPAAVGIETYIASMDADPTGRYVYYIPGAHGSGARDGTPVIQFDTKTRTRKVIAFLHAYYQSKFGFSPSGTYCTVLNHDGSTLFVTFNTNRGTKSWDHCTLFAIQIPESERATDAVAQSKPHPSAKWETAIREFEKADRESPPPANAVLFIGSSTIRLWKTLKQDFPDHAVINRGFGGSQMADSVYFADRIVIPYKPKQIVVYAGSNDLAAGKTPDQVANDFKAFVEQVRVKLPETRISFMGIGPSPLRWAQTDRQKQANRLIKQYIESGKNLDYIEVWDQFLGPDGKPREEFFMFDRLHNSESGYKIRVEAVRPFLK